MTVNFGLSGYLGEKKLWLERRWELVVNAQSVMLFFVFDIHNVKFLIIIII